MPRATLAETTPLLRSESDGREDMSTGQDQPAAAERSSASMMIQPWIVYVLVAYTGLLVQVALAPDKFLDAASTSTLVFDGLRVALFSVLWISLTVVLWKADCWPQWFLDKRVGKPGKEAMPATIVVSFVHSCASVGVGIAIFAPIVATAEWQWYKPMTESIATYVSQPHARSCAVLCYSVEHRWTKRLALTVLSFLG